MDGRGVSIRCGLSQHITDMHEKAAARHIRMPAWTVWFCLVFVALLSGCQKRCESWDLGFAKLGMHYSFYPGPVELLDIARYKYKGPDYPQTSVADRMKTHILERHPLDSPAAPLQHWLTSQHFTCERQARDLHCHVAIETTLEERCSLLDRSDTHKFNEIIDLVIQEDKATIKAVTVTYDIKPKSEGNDHGGILH